MTANHFDALTRDLACSTSRRHALKAIFAGTVGSALGFIALSTAQAAACLHFGATCKSDSECCSGRCLANFGSPGHSCSCLVRGTKCKEDRNCCENLKCIHDVCA
jgi:hypothetical protein